MSAHRQPPISERLSERDWRILTTIGVFRFLTTRQLSRQHFDARGSDCAIPRAANRALARLNELGLINSLARRIGGVRAGSAGHIWHLTDQGNRLLAQRLHEPAPTRIRPFEPGTAFLEHTLAIAEVVISLQEAAATSDIVVHHLELEPTCWRDYTTVHGAPMRLKPDLAATTRHHSFEDMWFFEIDRDTEPPGRVVTKCEQYQQYRASGIEQDTYGIFPAVVWIVPNQRRRTQLTQRLASEPRIDSDLFTVITPDQLTDVVQVGADTFNSQPGGQEGGHTS